MQEVLNAIESFALNTLGMSSGRVSQLLVTVEVLLVYLLLSWLSKRILHRKITDLERRYIAVKMSRYLLTTLLLLFLIKTWLWGEGGKSLAGYISIISAGLAIALHAPLTNLAGGLFIAVRRPFKIGDRIEINSLRGDVIDTRMFQFSIVETGNWVDADQSTGRIIHIPNSLVFQNALANYTQGFNFIWDELPVTVTFESDWKKAKHILLEIAEQHNAVKSENAKKELRKAARKYLIYFQHLSPIVWTSMADIGVTLTMRYLVQPRKRRSTQTRIIEEILSAFAEHDTIDFAYPTTRFYNNAEEGKPGAGGRAELRAANPPDTDR